jgi:hypothetical protein
MIPDEGLVPDFTNDLPAPISIRVIKTVTLAIPEARGEAPPEQAAAWAWPAFILHGQPGCSGRATPRRRRMTRSRHARLSYRRLPHLG